MRNKRGQISIQDIPVKEMNGKKEIAQSMGKKSEGERRESELSLFELRVVVTGK